MNIAVVRRRLGKVAAVDNWRERMDIHTLRMVAEVADVVVVVVVATGYLRFGG